MGLSRCCRFLRSDRASRAAHKAFSPYVEANFASARRFASRAGDVGGHTVNDYQLFFPSSGLINVFCNRSRRGDCSRLEACTTRDYHPLGYVTTAVILARRHDRERLPVHKSQLHWQHRNALRWLGSFLKSQIRSGAMLTLPAGAW
jgi:hypothetical protein